jgi:hypothetical protein
MKLITALAALSLVIGSLSPAQAQEKVVLEDLGITFKTVAGYDIVPPEKRASGLDFELRGQWSKSKLGGITGNTRVTVHVVDGMAILALPPDRTGLYKPGELPESDVKVISFIIEKIAPGFVIQKTAKIKLANHDAIACLFSIDIPEANDEATGRMIFVASKSQVLIIFFATTNEQWSQRSPDLDKMMSTLKFIGEESAKPTPPTSKPAPPTKPAPAKPGKKGKGQ